MYGTLEELPLISQKGHYRRAELLQHLSVGDVTDKVCVDFGTGSWGFAGIFPRLHHCKFAYGLDISKFALARSEELSRSSKFPYGDRIQYLQSDGLDLPIPDQRADLVFAGESIEHVRVPMRFLAECYRVLRPGGQLVITTPNRDAILYKLHSDQYCVSPEHFWLFNTEELRVAVSEFFRIDEFLGFNGSIYRTLDRQVSDEKAVEAWAKLFCDKPELATGVVLRATKDSDGAVKQYKTRSLATDSIHVQGQSQVLDLSFGLTGTMISDAESAIRFMCPPCAAMIIYLWTHAWSGKASIRCDSDSYEFDLWSQDPGWKAVHLKFEAQRNRTVEIQATGRKDRRALNHQVIFFEAAVYDY